MIKPSPSKVHEWWRHLERCKNAPQHVNVEAKQEVLARRQHKATKENTALAVLPVHQMTGRPVPLSLTRTVSIIDTPTTPTPVCDAAERPTNRQRMESTTSIEGDHIAPFYGELFSDPPPWSAEQQAKFSADLCRLLVVCNIAWMAVEIPFWRAFFTKWLPQCQMPGRRELSGRILDQESAKVLENMKEKVKDRFGTGQCDGWKNINKTSIIGTMVNVEYEVCYFCQYELHLDDNLIFDNYSLTFSTQLTCPHFQKQLQNC
jgi:hypothetical protein